MSSQKPPKFPIFYTLLAWGIYLITFPFLILLRFKSKYKDSIPARFFCKNFTLDFKPKYWFHSCSFGESKSYEPIIQALLQKEPNAKILLTCITNTGFAYLKTLQNKFHKNCKVHYLPFEIFLPFWNPSLNELHTLIVTEAELWKMLFYVAKKNNAKTLLVNARISDRSYPSYQKFAWFYRGVFALIDEVLTQQDIDTQRLQTLGANAKTFGNLKVFSTPQVTHHYPKTKDVILCASTHKEEEKMILQAFLPLNLDATLIIVPRHPERFIEVQEICQTLCKQFGKTFSTFQEKWGDVVLVNAMGELHNFYAIADCVLLCGSFVPIGGHNPLEPAFFHAPILSGKHIYNQKALFSLIEGYTLICENELAGKLSSYKSLPRTSILSKDNKLETLLASIQN